MENIAQILIYLHIGLGSLALLTGMGAILVKKGSSIHKKFGRLFYYSMLVAAVISIIIASLPNHYSLFLIYIAIFSLYFVLLGKRSLGFAAKKKADGWDQTISVGIILMGIIMLFSAFLSNANFNIVLAVFGITGIYFGLQDLRIYKYRNKLRKNSLKWHVRNMMGAFIASVTALFVVNDVLPGAYNWFAPGVIGGIYITYWMFQLSKKDFNVYKS